MVACAGLPLGIVTKCFGEWKYFSRPGAGAWARGPAAVGVAELSGDTGPPEATGAGGPRAAERFTSGRKGAMSRRSSASRSRVALIRVSARHSAGRPAWAARGAPCDRARQLSESNLRGLREASPVGHVPRRGDRGRAGRAYWPDRLRPDAVLDFPTGVLLPFSPGPRGPGK